VSIDEGIHRFWIWWATARDRVLRAIEVERKFSDELVRDIAHHVKAIGDLDWELAPGKTSKHAFCLSPKGDPEARLITELWRHRGPPPDTTWEYFAARQPGQHSTLVLDNVTFDRNELVVAFEVDSGRERIDATFFHPRFSLLTARLQTNALYLMLDGAFGEDGVERWLGRIEATTKKPKKGASFKAFAAALAELERSATRDQFAILEGGADDEPVVMTVNRSLKRIDHIVYTVHLAVDLAILDQNPKGLTTPEDAAQLNRLEDELTTALGSVAVYFGRETRRGHRVMHWYTPEDSAAQAIVERWTAGHGDRRPSVEWIRDPTWEFVTRYV
jgi:hypothetical protein